MRKKRKGAMPVFDRTLRDMISDEGIESEPLPRLDGPTGPPEGKPLKEARPGKRVDPLGPGSDRASVKALVIDSMRSGRDVIIPSLDRTTYRFPDSGPRIFIELLFTDRAFLDMVTVKETVDEMTFVRLHPSIRSDGRSGPSMTSEALLRGLAPLCELILDGKVDLDPTENEWKYMDSVLGLFCDPVVKGRVREWDLRIGDKGHHVRCEVSMDALGYTYQSSSVP